MDVTWSITQLDRNLPDGGVYCAHWSVLAVDGEYSTYTYSTANFTPNPAAPDFKPYDQLTQDDVLAWVWGSLDKATVEASLAQQIALQKAPVTANGLPW
jgi:hypothetical protein